MDMQMESYQQTCCFNTRFPKGYTDLALRKLSMPVCQISYSEKYDDGQFEYRHVHLPQDIASLVPRGRLMSEGEWRHLGVMQSAGWVHYLLHRPEPHILLFRRTISQQQSS